MKAIICTKYGPPEVLQKVNIAKPIPKGNEVLIKIHAATVHIGDTKIRGFNPGLGPVKDIFFKPLMRLILGFSGPRKKILGMELAGEIAGIGDKVKTWKIGDQVFAATKARFGAYAEFTCLPENGVISQKPVNMTYDEAATIPNGGITALLILRKAKIQSGQKILIYGASGSVGSFAVQLAKNLGAVVTGVCSTGNTELVKSLGADFAIDYTIKDFSSLFETYDVILDAVGKMKPSFLKKFLSKTGIYLNVLTSPDALKLRTIDLVYLKDLIEERKLRPVIDRKYSLEEIVEAHRYVEIGHKKGNVVITI